MLKKIIKFTIGEWIDQEGSSEFNDILDYLEIDVNENLINELGYNVQLRYDEFYIYKKELNFNESELLDQADANIINKRICNVINMTYERYAPLIKTYRDQVNDLIPQLASSNDNTTRFNDTPQNGGDYSDDPHSSNITQSHSEAKVDNGSLMARLEEARRNWRALIRDWTDEFKGLFMVN